MGKQAKRPIQIPLLDIKRKYERCKFHACKESESLYKEGKSPINFNIIYEIVFLKKDSGRFIIEFS